jgi:hypothetical protein
VIELLALAKRVRDSVKRDEPERFALSKILEVFERWKATVKDIEDGAKPVFRACKQRTEGAVIGFEVETLKFRSTWWEQPCVTRAGTTNEIHIKLPNDGFMYSDSSDMPTVGGAVERHRSPAWMKLNEGSEDVYRAFSPLVEYAADLMKCEYADIRAAVYYNDEENRIDFIALNDTETRKVVITFEPGYPDKDTFKKWKPPPKS